MKAGELQIRFLQMKRVAFLLLMPLLGACQPEDLVDPQEISGVASQGLTTTTSFQNGVGSYTGCVDTSLVLGAPTQNFGDGGVLDVDSQDSTGGLMKPAHILIRCDLSQIPTNATVQSAQLTYTVKNTTTSAGFEAYEVVVPWDESQATAIERVTGTRWQLRGAAGPRDYRPEVVATFTGSKQGETTISIDVSQVQKWVSWPSKNFGLVVMNDGADHNDGLEIGSSNADVATGRPKLTIAYTTPDPIVPDGGSPQEDAGTSSAEDAGTNDLPPREPKDVKGMACSSTSVQLAGLALFVFAVTFWLIRRRES